MLHARRIPDTGSLKGLSPGSDFRGVGGYFPEAAFFSRVEQFLTSIAVQRFAQVRPDICGMSTSERSRSIFLFVLSATFMESGPLLAESTRKCARLRIATMIGINHQNGSERPLDRAGHDNQLSAKL